MGYRFQQELRDSRVNTSKAIVQAILKADKKPEIFVNISGINIYKTMEDEVYTEKSPVSGYDFLSNLNLDWEKAALLPQDVSTRQVYNISFNLIDYNID